VNELRRISISGHQCNPNIVQPSLDFFVVNPFQMRRLLSFVTTHHFTMITRTLSSCRLARSKH
jgi:hypothetical protein